MEDRVIVRALLIVEKDSAPEDRPHRRSRFLCASDLLERDAPLPFTLSESSH
jgi:hypothetical protein